MPFDTTPQVCSVYGPVFTAIERRLKDRYHIAIRDHLGGMEIPAASGTLDPSMGGMVRGLGGPQDYTTPGGYVFGKVIEGNTVLEGITFVPKDFQLLLDLFRSAKTPQGDTAFHYHPFQVRRGGAIWNGTKMLLQFVGLDWIELSYEETKIGMPGTTQEHAWGFREIVDDNNAIAGPLEIAPATYPGKDRFELKFGQTPQRYARRIDITSLHVALTPFACNIHIDNVGFVLRGPRSMVGVDANMLQHLVNELVWKSLLRDWLVDKYGHAAKAVWAVDHLSLMLPSSDTHYAPMAGVRFDLGDVHLTAAFSFNCRCLTSEPLTIEERIVPISDGKSGGIGLEIDF